MVLTTNEINNLNNMRSKGIISACFGKFKPKDAVCEHNVYNVKATDCIACHSIRNNKELKKKYDSGETLNEFNERILSLKDDKEKSEDI